MIGGVEMFCGMFIFRGIAAAHMSAGQAEAQVHPTVANLYTLFAALGLWLHAANLIEMGTLIGHGFLLQNQSAA